MSNDFRFKRFAVAQQRSAMKVGTDGVLLGAWARVEPTHRAILDVGSGTGVVALMMAQRTESFGAYITAVEINVESAADSRDNFCASPWAERLAIECCAVQDYAPEERFDHIVSNPPYFVDSLRSPDGGRTLARHTDSLSFDELMRAVERMLSKEGIVSLILPYEALSAITLSAARVGLFMSRRCDVSSKSGGKPIRIMVEFSRRGSACQRSELAIRDTEGYTADYIALTRDFYLKF